MKNPMKTISGKVGWEKIFNLASASFLFTLLVTVLTSIFLLGIGELSSIATVNFSTMLASFLFGVSMFFATIFYTEHFEEENMLLKCMLFFLCCCSAFECLSWLVDGNPNLKTENVLANEFLYLSSAFLVYFFWLFTINIFQGGPERYRRFTVLFTVMLWVHFTLIVTNPFTHLYFSVSAEGVYSRSKTYFISQLLATSIIVVDLYFLVRNPMKKTERIPLILYCVFPFLALLIAFFYYGVSLIYVNTFIGFILLFSNIYMQNNLVLSEKRKEMNFASNIQYSMVPDHFEGEGSRCEISALMRTAKEVGGDFYDFYRLDDTHTLFLVADVSGKGIPAAMFMMQGISSIKDFALSGMNVKDIMCHTNDSLCAHNGENLFITCWAGILDESTGVVEVVNAGHNLPVLKKADGTTSFVNLRSGLPLASFEGFNYRPKQFVLEPGDTLFLYTDGVTEAENLNHDLFGDDRLLKCVEENNGSTGQLCDNVVYNVDRFAGEARQFDDITMVAIRYR